MYKAVESAYPKAFVYNVMIDSLKDYLSMVLPVDSVLAVLNRVKPVDQLPSIAYHVLVATKWKDGNVCQKFR